MGFFSAHINIPGSLSSKWQMPHWVTWSPGFTINCVANDWVIHKVICWVKSELPYIRSTVTNIHIILIVQHGAMPHLLAQWLSSSCASPNSSAHQWSSHLWSGCIVSPAVAESHTLPRLDKRAAAYIFIQQIYPAMPTLGNCVFQVAIALNSRPHIDPFKLNLLPQMCISLVYWESQYLPWPSEIAVISHTCTYISSPWNCTYTLQQVLIN